MKSSTHYFHMKAKILPDFQICISVPLMHIGSLMFLWKYILKYRHLVTFVRNIQERKILELLSSHKLCLTLLTWRYI